MTDYGEHGIASMVVVTAGSPCLLSLVAQVKRVAVVAEMVKEQDAKLNCHVSRAVMSRSVMLPGQA